MSASALIIYISSYKIPLIIVMLSGRYTELLYNYT
jgi:hypothetical protein